MTDTTGKADYKQLPRVIDPANQGEAMPRLYRKRPVEVEVEKFDSVEAGSWIAEWSGGSNELSPPMRSRSRRWKAR